METAMGFVAARRMRALFGVVAVSLIGLAATTAHTAASSTWTKGHKKVLIIPIRFTDFGGPSDSPGPGGYLSGWGKVLDGTTSAALASFMAQQSYGLCTMDFTVIPEINLGVSYTAYNALYPGTSLSKYTLWYEPNSLADDARAKAKQAGLLTATPAKYDSANYDLDIIIGGFIPGQGTQAAGQSYIKGVFGTTTKALAHELCHNLGLQHANGVSRATLQSPLRNGSYFIDSYGDVDCLMGYKNTWPIPLPPDRDANPYWKYRLGWLTEEHIFDPVTSGTYRLYAFDQGTLDTGKKYAIRIPRDTGHVYWLDFRQAITGAGDTWSANGLEVHFGGESVPGSSGLTTLIDMTPGSRGLTGSTFSTMYDAPLAIGRTFTDAEMNLHVTPIKKGGTTPESLDVVLNFGPIPGNNAPTVSIAPTSLNLSAGVPTTFTATASDPDGDTLAYYWEFDDNATTGGYQSGGSDPDSRLATQGSHTWTQDGTYFVRCTVTDMKGHTATASATVTVTGGTAAPLTISGMVKDELGNPLEGAVVNNFKGTAPNAVSYDAANFATSNPTGPDGKYIIPLPAIGASTYTLTVMYKGFTFNCTKAGGVVPTTSTSVADVDFTRIRTTRTISGSIVVAGRAYDPATDGNITISDGTTSTLATLGSWSLTEPDGTYVNLTFTPANPAYTIITYFKTPFWVVDDYNQLHLDVKIPGKLPETAFTTSTATSDDNVGTVNIPITMTLPVGYSSWVADQSAQCWIDNSSTAEYGVDYKMTGGKVVFAGGVAPTPKSIPLTIIHDGVPKNKTVVVKMGAGSSLSNLGPITTFTYTIINPATPVTISGWSLDDP
ncbi:MAG: PKD domain-containing protein [Candidatus Sumerlaeaceae bacterium]|nr:PKD domain-containing protein [Candidatus Sumerlaeaceae bacterium]